MDKNIKTAVENLDYIDKQFLARRKEEAIETYEANVKEISEAPTLTLLLMQTQYCYATLATIDTFLMLDKETLKKEYGRIVELKDKRLKELEAKGV